MRNKKEEDDYGLPDIEYKPLEELSHIERKPIDESQSYYYEEDEETSNSGVIIALIVGLVMLLGGFLAYKYVWKPKHDRTERPKTEETAPIGDPIIVHEEMTLVSTSPEGCNVYMLKGTMIIICPEGYKATQTK